MPRYAFHKFVRIYTVDLNLTAYFRRCWRPPGRAGIHAYMFGTRPYRTGTVLCFCSCSCSYSGLHILKPCGSYFVCIEVIFYVLFNCKEFKDLRRHPLPLQHFPTVPFVSVEGSPIIMLDVDEAPFEPIGIERSEASCA